MLHHYFSEDCLHSATFWKKILKVVSLSLHIYVGVEVNKFFQAASSMPRPQFQEGFSDTDSAVTENDEGGEESEIPIANQVEEPCEEFEDKTR